MLRSHIQVLLWKTADKESPPLYAQDSANNGWDITGDYAIIPVIADQPLALKQLLQVVRFSCNIESDMLYEELQVPERWAIMHRVLQIWGENERCNNLFSKIDFEYDIEVNDDNVYEDDGNEGDH